MGFVSTLLKSDLVEVNRRLRFPVTNPHSGEVIASVTDMTFDDIAVAVRDANEGFEVWANETPKLRHDCLQKWRDLILESADELASLITAEQGKPLSEAEAEIVYSADYLNWYAAEALRLQSQIQMGANKEQSRIIKKRPVGVVGAITPWNFPMAMIARKAGAALAAGCAIIVKPSEETPLSAMAFVKLAYQAGIPDNVIKLVTVSRQNAPDVGRVFTSSPSIKKVSFTGSSIVGKILAQQSSVTIQKVSLELGGNAPLIVFDDCDLETTIDQIIIAKFRNSGQTCICANRIFVQSEIHDRFVAALSARVGEFNVGDGADRTNQITPLINLAAVEKVSLLVEEAIASGASISSGMDGLRYNGNAIYPAVLTGVTDDMRIANEEIFGPVAAVLKFESEEEVIARSNDTPYGLAAYVFTSDISKALRVSNHLHVGMVGANTGAISDASIPFGGVKESGIGREGGPNGIEDYLETQYICLQGSERLF